MNKKEEKNLTPEVNPEEQGKATEAELKEKQKQTDPKVKLKERYFGCKLIYAEPMEYVDYLHKKTGEEVIDCVDQLGYEVEYEDGYISWSPKETFEEAYYRVDYLNFGQAIEAMKQGHKVARKGWNGKGIHIEIQVPDENSKMTSPYIFIDTTGLATDNKFAPKSCVPWLASQTDMLAEDWIIIFG